MTHLKIEVVSPDENEEEEVEAIFTVRCLNGI
jgi:hypothetical protein